LAPADYQHFNAQSNILNAKVFFFNAKISFGDADWNDLISKLENPSGAILRVKRF